ncbi:MAG: hypothetical protein KKB50_01050 [Planctomycetes bacterium]|nr:hypothetical protein [Planctomycetota bacterium]
MAEQPATEPGSPEDFDRQPAVARLETDWFCDGCGYNLHTQPVRRDTRTRLLLCRCPECGGLQAVRNGTTAGRAWLHRLGMLGLFFWILLLLGLVFGFGSAQLVVTAGMLEELTFYRPVNVAPAPPPAASAPTTTSTDTTAAPPDQIVRIGDVTVRAPSVPALPGSTGNRGTTTVWRRTVRAEFEHQTFFMILMRGLAVVAGFGLIALLTIALHHWPRWGYAVPAVLVPLVLGYGLWYFWCAEYPHLRDWATGHIAWNTVAGLAGGLAAVFLGRPFARLAVVLALPPRIRQVLAFLWLADARMPPAVSAGE